MLNGIYIFDYEHILILKFIPYNLELNKTKKLIINNI